MKVRLKTSQDPPQRRNLVPSKTVLGMSGNTFFCPKHFPCFGSSFQSFPAPHRIEWARFRCAAWAHLGARLGRSDLLYIAGGMYWGTCYGTYCRRAKALIRATGDHGGPRGAAAWLKHSFKGLTGAVSF